MELLTNSEFEARLNGFCEQYNLMEYREWIRTNNSVRGMSHYHSCFHMDGVTILAMSLLPETATDRDSIFCLLAAAMIHDMDHSLGEFEDNINIQNAIAALRDWTWNQPHDSDFKRLLPDIERMIYITEYPYSDLRVPQTEYEKALRDADILWGVMPGRAVTIVEGLREELIPKFPQYAHLDLRLVHFVYDRIDFLYSLRFSTEKGRKLFNRWILNHKLEMLDYINAFKINQDRN